MSVHALAVYLAEQIKKAQDNSGVAERAVVSGSTVVTGHGAYAYDLACPVNMYDGKTVWVQLSNDGTAVVIGD